MNTLICSNCGKECDPKRAEVVEDRFGVAACEACGGELWALSPLNRRLEGVVFLQEINNFKRF